MGIVNDELSLHSKLSRLYMLYNVFRSLPQRIIRTMIANGINGFRVI